MKTIPKPGAYVRAYRLSHKPPIKQAALAKKVKMTAANLSRIENGLQDISEAALPRFVATTGIPAQILRPDLAHLFIAPKSMHREVA
jgi:transcriptional regulator with XRE-family HTH domain